MHTNRLIHEKSPYLLQHANNPVDWRPWGPEAFEQSRTEEKPIFLSIGYSTCHWCHVMERESFENEDVADILNQHFVPIKVDREERPDVDRIYMTFVQATTGGGGWPVSVWLTPELKPFYGGTYFPRDTQYGRPGFKTILERLAELWAVDRARILESSLEVHRQLESYARTEAQARATDAGALDSAFGSFRRMFDSKLGGFGGAPKFPRPVVHNFLVRYWKRGGSQEALDMVLKTLEQMARGGMRDQLGGGFHRYSVDERWFVPHFEKMLYDQAQLAISYIEAYQITGDQFHAEMARDILEYVLREMTHPEGGFYSAEDADSVIDPAKPEIKGEGAFYLWSRAELAEALRPESLDLFAYRYGVEPEGNVENDPHGEFTGKNILFEAHTVEETARRFNADPDEVSAALEAARKKLLEARAKRVRPHLDDKVLTAWNALMISAFAKGAQALGEARYAEAARRATDFVLRRMYEPETATLLRRFRDSDAAIPGFLDDYAFFVQALIDLYETEFDGKRLAQAVQITERLRELFEDAGGGFYSTAAGDANLILRLKDDYDGAEPSGNATAALALLRLERLTHRADFRESAERALRAFSNKLASSGAAIPQMLVALEYSLAEPKQVVIAGERALAEPLIETVARRFSPDLETLFVESDGARETLRQWLPEIDGMRPPDGKPAAWVCVNFTCRLPVTTVEELGALLE